MNSEAVLRTYTWPALSLSNGNSETPLTMTDSDGTFFYVTDNNKNVTELVDSAGAVRAHYEYSPFGKITNITGDKAEDNPIRFSSEYFDKETGLVYYNYRYYSPELGRWFSRDPIEEIGGVNLYVMVGNNPVNWWDLLGFTSISVQTIPSGSNQSLQLLIRKYDVDERCEINFIQIKNDPGAGEPHQNTFDAGRTDFPFYFSSEEVTQYTNAQLPILFPEINSISPDILDDYVAFGDTTTSKTVRFTLYILEKCNKDGKRTVKVLDKINWGPGAKDPTANLSDLLAGNTVVLGHNSWPHGPVKPNPFIPIVVIPTTANDTANYIPNQDDIFNDLMMNNLHQFLNELNNPIQIPSIRTRY